MLGKPQEGPWKIQGLPEGANAWAGPALPISIPISTRADDRTFKLTATGQAKRHIEHGARPRGCRMERLHPS